MRERGFRVVEAGSLNFRQQCRFIALDGRTAITALLDLTENQNMLDVKGADHVRRRSAPVCRTAQRFADSHLPAQSRDYPANPLTKDCIEALGVEYAKDTLKGGRSSAPKHDAASLP